MDLDRILQTFNACHVDYLLIGGMNFLLRHEPVLTYDVDLWIDDVPENRDRAERALAELQAQWGTTEDDWRPVAGRSAGWLARQGLFCLTSPAGAIDIFRAVRGLESWAECRQRAVLGVTGAGTPYVGLSDADMLQCQTALLEPEQKQDRIRTLRAAIARAAYEP
jgi:hypothetical protein